MTNNNGLVIRYFMNGYYLCDGKAPEGNENDSELYVGNTIKWFETWEEADAMKQMIDNAYKNQNIKEMHNMGMTLNDYKEQVKNDLLEYAKECYEYDKDITAEQIMEQAWTADSVTGNGSGSYTFNTYEAEKNLSELVWDDELLDIFKDFGYDSIPLDKGAEAIDVIIRCYLLSEFTDDVQNLIDELNLNSDSNDDETKDE